MRLPSSCCCCSLTVVPLPLPGHKQSLMTRYGGAHRPAVVAPAPSPRCPCPRRSLFPPHEQLLAAAVGGAEVVVAIIVLVVPSPRRRGYRAVAVLGRPCPHRQSLSWLLSPSLSCLVVVVVAVPSLLSFCPLHVVPALVAPRVHPTNSHSRWRYLIIPSPSLSSILAPPVHHASSGSQQ